MPVSGQIVGRDASVQIEDSGGTMRNVSGDLNSITIDMAVETPETTAYGDTFRTRSGSGLRDITISYEGFFNDTASTGVETVLSGLLAQGTQAIIGPAGSATGYRKLTACTLLTGYSITPALDGMTQISFEMVGRAGSPTWATW